MERYIRTSTAGIRDALNGAVGRCPLSVGSAFGKVCADFTYDKDSEDVFDDLLTLVWAVSTATNVPLDSLMESVEAGRLKAHAKHGENSIEAKAGSDTLFWLACLGEEYGELCDEVDDLPRYRAEGVDVATVATAWLAALARVD